MSRVCDILYLYLTKVQPKEPVIPLSQGELAKIAGASQAQMERCVQILKKEEVLARTKELFRQVLEAQDCLSVRDLAVGGTDLIEAGVPQGREVGQMLSWLLDQVLETPELNKKEILMRLVKEKREREQ